jgi:5-methylthioadenosine/S-adenosylhomocysteine deaminase
MKNETLIVKNALLVSCDPEHTVLHDAAVIVRDGRFDWIGPAHDLPPTPGARIIDAAGAILMPGLVNMHAHCGDTLFRGLVEDLPLEPWLQTVWKAEAALLGDPDTCRIGVELGIAELVLGGVTTVMDMFWHADQGFGAAHKAGIRWASGEMFFDGPGMDGHAPDTRPGRARDLFEQGHEFTGALPHGTYTTGPDSIRAALDLAQEYDGFFCTHAAETAAEQDTVRQRYDTSVIRHLDTLGTLGPRSILAHCVHVDPDEIALMAKTGTHVVLNPASNLKLASGFAPVPAMITAGINLTLGTDGPVSGNDTDMFLAMRLTATLHKAASGDAAAVTAPRVLHMATLNAARALGADHRLGSIETGKEADFILVDTTGPHATPMFNPVGHLVYSANKADVRDAFVAGRQIMANRTLLTLDVPALVSRIKALQPAILASLETQ